MDKKELENLEKIKELSESQGGIYLKDTCKEVILNTVDIISNTYQEKTHIELISLCAKLSANLGLYKLLSNTSDQIEAIKNILEEK